MNPRLLALSVAVVLALPAADGRAAAPWEDDCREAARAPRSLTRPVIERRMRSLKPAVGWCYREELRRRPGARGKAYLELAVAADGTLSEVAVETKDFDGAPLAGCIEAAARTLRFPPVAGGASVRFRYPFTLQGPAAEDGEGCPAQPPEQAAAARVAQLEAELESVGGAASPKGGRVLRAIADETARLLNPAEPGGLGRFARPGAAPPSAAAGDEDEARRLVETFGCAQRAERWLARAHNAHERLLAAGGGAAGDPDLRYLTALLAWEAGRRDQAAAHLEALLAAPGDAPHAAPARLFLTLHRAETGALGAAEAVAALGAAAPERRAALLADLARSYEARGAWEAAVTAWAAVVQAETDAAARAAALAARIAAAERLGRPDALVAAAREAVAAAPVGGAPAPPLDDALAAAALTLAAELRDTCDPATAAAARTLAALHRATFPASAHAGAIADALGWLGGAGGAGHDQK